MIFDYGFDEILLLSIVHLFQALISVFVMYSKDGWVELMYDGLDAVGVDQQVFGFTPTCS